MLKRVLNAELEKKVFEDEMMEKLSVVPAEYEVYEEYASRQEDFDRDFFTYCNKTPLLVDADVASYDESEENVGVPNCKEKSLETFMAESQEEINKKKLEEARIKYHYKWSTQYIRKLEEENHRIRQNNCRLAKRNERLEEKNQNLLSECKDLRKVEVDLSSFMILEELIPFFVRYRYMHSASLIFSPSPIPPDTIHCELGFSSK